MVLFPPAKINIGLFITEKRPDGFHALETCFVQIPWNDILEITPATNFSFSSSGLPISGSVATNLCVRAYELLKKDFSLAPVHIHLHKIIPMGAGLGGGSSDAAYTLMGLRNVFELPLSNEDLVPYAQQLGSDCAFFLFNQAQFGQGKGDELSPISLSLKGYFVLLAYPNFGISTQQAYAQVKPKPAPVFLPDAISLPMNSWKAQINNDFEESLFPSYPLLEQMKKEMYSLGAEYAAMSGSGSTMFGIFKQKIDPPEGWADFPTWSGFIS
jgi:4-diphosphocytidyl-2-C-methyl-D-erythritol kinase